MTSASASLAPASVQEAVDLGVIDRFDTDPAQAVAGADMVLVAVPLGAMESVFSRIRGHLAENAVLTDAGTTIDGTTQTDNIGNTNNVTLGTGGNVGVDSVLLGQLNGPEVEIRDGAALGNGLLLQANDLTVRGLAILGFGSGDTTVAISVDGNVVGISNFLIENNVLGATATSFIDPGTALRNEISVNVFNGAFDGTIQNNLVGFAKRRGIWLQGGDLSIVSGNEVKDNGLETDDGDGIALASSSDNVTVSENLITGSSSQGLVVTSSKDIAFVNNTVTDNGVGTSSIAATQSAGITLRESAKRVTIDRNVVYANYGAGLQVNNNDSIKSIFTRNSFYDNGSITSRNSGGATGQIGIDLNAPGDDSDLGTAPFYSINDAGDGDPGGNTLFNFPVLETATIVGESAAMLEQPGLELPVEPAQGRQVLPTERTDRHLAISPRKWTADRAGGERHVGKNLLPRVRPITVRVEVHPGVAVAPVGGEAVVLELAAAAARVRRGEGHALALVAIEKTPVGVLGLEKMT